MGTRHRERHGRRLVALTLLLGAASLGLAARAPQAGAALDCTHTWDGGGDGINWESAANWSPEVVPGTGTSGAAQVVCIPSAATTVHINAGEEERVQAVIAAGRIRINQGAKLFLDGDPALGRSTIANLDLLGGGILGGLGTVEITGTLRWRTGPTFVSTMTTRDLDEIAPAPGGSTAAPGRFGTTIIKPGAQLLVLDDDATGCSLYSGNGVQLRDGRRIQNRGTTAIDPCVYVAADWGTRFDNFGTTRIVGAPGNPPGPVMVLPGGLGYYEGFLGSTLGWPTSPPLWTNQTGSVLAMNGVARQSFTIAARYASSGATVTVADGARLDVLDSAPLATRLTAGLGRGARGSVGATACVAAPGGSDCAVMHSSTFQNSDAGSAPLRAAGTPTAFMLTTLVQEARNIGALYGSTGLRVAGEQLSFSTSGGAATAQKPHLVTIVARLQPRLDGTYPPATSFSVGRNGRTLGRCGVVPGLPCWSEKVKIAPDQLRIVIRTVAPSDVFVPLGPRFKY